MPSRKKSAKGDAPFSGGSLPAGRQPDVIVEFLFDDGLLFVSVRNIGDEPALSVTTRFNKALTGLAGQREISSLAMFRRIAFLAPQRAITTFVDSSESYFRRRQPTRVTVTIEWRDRLGRRFSARITHDLSIYKDISFVSHSQSQREFKHTKEE